MQRRWRTRDHYLPRGDYKTRRGLRIDMKNRKRQKISVSGLSAGGSVESCLEELEALSGVAGAESKASEVPKSSKKRKTLFKDDHDVDDVTRIDTSDDILWDPSLKSGASALCATNPKVILREKVSEWNKAMRIWSAKKGKGVYTRGLLPSLEVEVARHFQVEQLSSFLLKACDTDSVKMPVFERWLIDARVEKEICFPGWKGHDVYDPVIGAACCSSSSRSSRRLLEELTDAGIKLEEAKKTIIALCRKATDAVSELSALGKRYADKIALHKGDRIVLEQHDQIYSLLFHCKSWKKPYCIRVAKTHYMKLKDMFLSVHNRSTDSAARLRFTDGGKPTKVLHAFHYLIMVMLVRYSSLSGGQLLLELRGGGMQGAVHGAVFRTLQAFFPNDPLLECFASPMNCYLPLFGSAFDIDWHFGSLGDFLTLDIISGCCEVNPPFAPGLMDKMVDHIVRCIEQADQRRACLSFVVIVPTVPDKDEMEAKTAAAKRHAAPSFRRMTQSPYCRKHFVLSAREHGYISGSQHLRLSRYKYSIFDTSVILLQSEMARKVDLDVEEFESRLRKSFASKHIKELNQRKGK